MVRSEQTSGRRRALTSLCRPDHCDGGYEQYCDQSRQYNNVTAILEAAGETELLNYMQVYWKDYQGDEESFWEHEWGKHGTCISTLETSCYSKYKAQEEVIDYFRIAVDVHKKLDSYKVLEHVGIVPSTTQSYTSARIQEALSKKHGHPVTIRCHDGELDEIWYHYWVRGSVQTGEFVEAPPDGAKSSCPQVGIKYMPKLAGKAPTSNASTTRARSSTASTPSPAVPGRAA